MGQPRARVRAAWLVGLATLGLLLAAGGLLVDAFAQQIEPKPPAQAPAPGPAQIQIQNRLGQIRRIQRVPGRGVDGTRTEEDLSLDGVFLPPDRTAKRRLEMAEQLIEEKRYGEAVRLLGSLLENAEDFFFKPNPDEPVFRSLKSEAGRLMSGLPAEGLESYELQFGARARAMLAEAAAAGDINQVAEVSRRFFHSQAGHEATFLLARHQLDQNRPLAAAMCLERLLATPAATARLEPVLSLTLAACWVRSGRTEKAQETLVALKRTHGKADVVIGGKPSKLFANNGQALAWFDEKLGPQPPARQVEAEQWALFRGDEGRNAASAGGQPLLNVRWRQRTADDRVVEKFVNKSRQDYLNQDMVALPSLHPLAVGDVVVMRTAFALQAVDFNNGKLVWKYPATDDSFEQFMKAGNAQPSGPGAQQLYIGLEQRIWEDATYGTISSDGDKVYFVEDLGLSGVNPNMLMTVLPNGQRRFSNNYRGTNHLAARELRTQGKLKWEVGGLTGEDEPKLAGAFFLGPPLPLLGRLYGLAEMKGQEIRLVVLSAETGALEWSQQLAVVDRAVSEDPFRRNAGASPSFADGVLVCPTAAGAVVAIDLTARSLLWGYQYPRLHQNYQDRFNAARITVYSAGERQNSDRWMDSSVTTANGRVLVTPVESDQLYCLNLPDGKELWKQPRAGNLYIGCVHKDHAILVRRTKMLAVKLADGETVWELDLPSGSMPSGRGFFSGDHYYLPLTTAEVAKVNLQTGKIEDRARSRSGSIPGNLVSYRGSILSQGADYLDAYYQVDALKTQIAKILAESPDDPKALASLGEVKVNEGALTEAADLFRRSYKLKPDDHTREQLVEAMLDALNADFAANRASLPELETLVEQPRHRLAFLRMKASGLQQAGDVLPAFEAYLKLADEDGAQTLDPVADRLSVRRDRWIRQQLERLRAVANSEQRAQIDAGVKARLQAAIEAPTVDPLRSFLAFFGAHPLGASARETLVSRLTNDDLLERQLLLRKDERSDDLAVAGATTARIAEMLNQAGSVDLAAIYYRKLATRFADVVCRDGKTGAQLVAALPAGPLATSVAASASWPAGNIEVVEDKAPPRGATANTRLPRTVDLEIIGQPGPLFEGVSLSYDMQQHLVAQDGLGEKRFRLLLAEQGGRINRSTYSVPTLSCARVNGGLLMLSLGNQVLAIDALHAADGSAERVLWTHDLNDQIGGSVQNQALLTRPVNVAWGATRYVPQDAAGRRVGSLGPVNDDGVYFQRLHDLYCVDPLSGKTLWMRKSVGAGNDLFGDEELLFVAPAGEADTLVVRASTGEELGKRRVPPFERRMATLGRLVLSWEPQMGGQHSLEMRDPWAEKTLWSHTFAAESRAALVGQEVVGVMQPDGEFMLVRLSDGKVLAKQTLVRESRLLGIQLLRSREGYLLVTNSVVRNEPNVTVQPVPNLPNSQISGHIYAFERESGKPLWEKPVEVNHQGLMASQPSELPILVLASQVHRLGAATQREPKVVLTCIDKRTGRTVYDNDGLPPATFGSYEINGDPAAHKVTITLAPKVFTLTLTDKPIVPAEAAAPKGAPDAAPQPAPESKE